MGYDFVVETPDLEIKARVKELRTQINELCQLRDTYPREERGRMPPFDSYTIDHFDIRNYTGTSPRYLKVQLQIDALVEEEDRVDLNHFRLNVWGMSHYRGWMAELGMVFHDDVSERPEWPTWTEAADVDDSPEAIAYKKAHDEVTRYHGLMDTPGIPVHKFSSNDGWHVLPAEAAAALRAYDLHLNAEPTYVEHVIPADGRERWDSWLAFMRNSVSHDGFRVY